MSPDAALTRCKAGHRCRDGENVHDPDTGEKLGRLGAIIHGGPFCDRCYGSVEYAIRSLPLDLRDLGKLLPPSLTPRLRDPELPEQPRTKKAPPLPMNSEVWATMELIDYETGVWAESVADAAGVEWDSYLAEHSRWDSRVRTACALLGYRMETFLGLTDVEHRARSKTLDPSDGHDPDRAIRQKADVFVTRDGWEGALKLLELHKDAQRLCGRHAGDRVDTPCSRCQSRALVREHERNEVVCRFCGRRSTDEEHETFLNAAMRAHGIPVDEEVEFVDRRLVPVPIVDIRDRPVEDNEGTL